MLNADLFVDRPSFLETWKPHALTHDEWPLLDYAKVYAWRIDTLAILRSKPNILAHARKYYAMPQHTAEFIMHWMDTYNPRKSSNRWMPFVLFTRQAEFVEFLEGLDADGENGLVEKCRDIGATWLACAYTVKKWLFEDDDATGWGSRKQELVDKLGDPDSIFEKMRLLTRRLPNIWVPDGFKVRDHATFMKLLNPDNGSTITGESGDNIGRGGRKKRFFKDEAQPLNAAILTPNGWSTMGQMRVGSLVIGGNGQCRLVTHINDCGTAKVYRITLRDGTTVECSENHLWSLIHRRTGKQSVMRTNEIIDRYKYRSPAGDFQYRYELPLTDPIRFFGGDALPLDPYVTGVLLGDGSINSGVVSFTSADVEVAANVASRVPDGCKVTKCASLYGYRIVDVRGRMGNKLINHSRARKAIRDAGIAGHLAHEKFIPDAYKFASVNDRLELLQGLMDTDGSASGGTTTYHTCSERLANDVRFIVQSLGGVASLNVKPDHRGFRDIYVLHLSIPEYMPLFKLTRKNAAYKRKQQFQRAIIRIEPIGEKVVRCITVDAPDGLYLTDHCIVTHNSAHYERPELIEAALGDNTDTQIDISSVNGLGNVFHRRRDAGVDWSPGLKIDKGYTRVFTFDWRDHPEKTQDWYDQRKAKAIREGMEHIFAQEVDRDYSAAIQNRIIHQEWLDACIDAHLIIPYLRIPPPDVWMAGLDVGDGGLDRNALAVRQWIILRSVAEWGERDPGITARRTIQAVRKHKGIKVQYDPIGVGSGVKTEYNRLVYDDKIITPGDVMLVPWNAGAEVVNKFDRVIEDDEQSILNKDFFKNMKAQAWWSFRTRAYKTWRVIQSIKNNEPLIIYHPDELLSLDRAGLGALLFPLIKELSQPTKGESTALQMIVNKKPPGTKSPNMADAVIQSYFPAPNDGAMALSGGYSG